MVIPRERLSERYIISELEEIEREDNFRLKRFEELKQKKARALVQRVPICPICKSPIDESNICTCEESKEKQRFITCPMCNNDDNIEDSEDKECICKDIEENKNTSQKNVSISDSISICTCDKAEGDVVMELCPFCDKQPEVKADQSVGTKNNKTNNPVILSQKSCSCERIGEKKQSIQKSTSGPKTLVENLSEKFCSCEKIGDKKKNPVKVIKEVSDTQENSCCCISSENPDADLENLCKSIVADKINKLKAINLQKSVKEDDLAKVTFSHTDKKLECIPCKPEKVKSNVSSVTRNENIKSTSNYEENSKNLSKVCSKCNNEKNNAKDDSKNITIHIIIGSENQGNTKEITSSQNIKQKSSSKEVAPQNDTMNIDNSKDLGIFVTEFKEVVTIKRFQNEDGTIKEEKQVVTMKTEAKNPNLMDPTGDQNRQTCLSPGKVSLKQNSSACSGKSGKVKISLPPVDKKSSLASNVSKDISVSSYTSCKTKSRNVSESTIESKVSIEEIECSSMGAQTGEPDKLSMNKCCINSNKNKGSSLTSSLSEKSSKSCMQNSSQKAKNDRSKSCCTIKIVSKPKDDKNEDRKVADQCFEIIKRLLIEANQSCQPKNKKTKSNSCTCKSKKGSKQLSSKTSQTSNSSCSSSVSTKSNTSEKKCKCAEEKSKKQEKCIKKPTEPPKPCETDTCLHKTTESTSNCKCKSGASLSVTKSDKISQCSSCASIVESKESLCVHKKKESESQNKCSCQNKNSNKSVQTNSKENLTYSSYNSKITSEESCKCQSENKKNICSACGSIIAPISPSSSFTKCGQKPTSSIKSCCKETLSKDLSCSCKTKVEENKCECKKGSKKNISFSSPAPCCKETKSADSITSSNSFEKNQGTQTDCPKCIKSVAKSNESSCSCNKPQPNTNAKKQCTHKNNSSTKPVPKKVEVPKQTCSCNKDSKPETKRPVGDKDSGRNSAICCHSNSESNIQQKKSCCSQSKRIEKSESKCSICAKKDEPKCSCKSQDSKFTSSNSSTKPVPKKVEVPKQTCSCNKDSKPETKRAVCDKDSGRNSAVCCQSNSESNIEQKKSCCSQSKRIEKSESKCSICAKKDEPKCSCKSQDSKSTSSSPSHSHSHTEKSCPKCSQQYEIRTIKAPSQKSSCSCQTPKDNECCKKRSKTSVQFIESEIICPICEPKSKEIGTSTRRSDRYDVRNVEMFKSAASKPLACTCSSDTYVGLDKWYDNVPKAKSYHGQCYH